MDAFAINATGRTPETSSTQDLNRGTRDLDLTINIEEIKNAIVALKNVD